jgi:hypothetical protein
MSESVQQVIQRAAPFLDDGIVLMQNEDTCWAYDGNIGRIWAFVSRRYEGVQAPAGWFFLQEAHYNRVMIKELTDAGAIEFGDVLTIGDRQARLARLIPQS